LRPFTQQGASTDVEIDRLAHSFLDFSQNYLSFQERNYRVPNI